LSSPKRLDSSSSEWRAVWLAPWFDDAPWFYWREDVLGLDVPDVLVPEARAAVWSSARWNPTSAVAMALADRMPTVQDRARVTAVDLMVPPQGIRPSTMRRQPEQEVWTGGWVSVNRP
jgi:hypothetical protein